ncbi:hypothetical protein P3S68_015471 [Capsicum galapagoense]
MEMDYINTSHPNFIGGTKAHEMALQQVKSSRIAAPNPRQKVKFSFAFSQTFAIGLANHIILMQSFCLLIATQDGVDLEKAPTSEKSLKSCAILARSVGGLVPDQVVRPAPEVEKTTVSGVFPSGYT